MARNKKQRRRFNTAKFQLDFKFPKCRQTKTCPGRKKKMARNTIGFDTAYLPLKVSINTGYLVILTSVATALLSGRK